LCSRPLDSDPRVAEMLAEAAAINARAESKGERYFFFFFFFFFLFRQCLFRPSRFSLWLPAVLCFFCLFFSDIIDRVCDVSAVSERRQARLACATDATRQLLRAVTRLDELDTAALFERPVDTKLFPDYPWVAGFDFLFCIFSPPILRFFVCWGALFFFVVGGAIGFSLTVDALQKKKKKKKKKKKNTSHTSGVIAHAMDLSTMRELVNGRTREGEGEPEAARDVPADPAAAALAARCCGTGFFPWFGALRCAVRLMAANAVRYSGPESEVGKYAVKFQTDALAALAKCEALGELSGGQSKGVCFFFFFFFFF
jgi:hypothetical protein